MRRDFLRVLDRLLVSMLNARAVPGIAIAFIVGQANSPVVLEEAPGSLGSILLSRVAATRSWRFLHAHLWSAVTGTTAHPFGDVEFVQAMTSIRAQLADVVDQPSIGAATPGTRGDLADRFLGGKDLRGSDHWIAAATEILHSISLEGLNRYHQWLFAAIPSSRCRCRVVFYPGCSSMDDLASARSHRPRQMAPDAPSMQSSASSWSAQMLWSRRVRSSSRSAIAPSMSGRSPGGARVVYEKGISVSGSVH